MKKILIMTLGIKEAETILNSYRELFRRNSFDEIVFIRTNNQNSIAQENEIKRILKEKIFYTFEIKKFDDFGEILKELAFSNKEESFSNFIKQKQNEGALLFLDITGGTKIMSSALTTILINNKNLEEIIYISGQRDKITGNVIGLPKIQATPKNIFTFFSSFYIYLDENLKNKKYIFLSDFLSENKNYFFNKEWNVFVDLIFFYANLMKGRFEVIKNSLFLNGKYERLVFERIVKNKDEIEAFFIRVKELIELKRADLNNNQKERRTLLELGYFFDLLKNNLENLLSVESLAYFYIFLEKLVNFILIRENFKDDNYEFFFDEKTYYLQEIISKDKKIIGLQKKIKFIKNKKLKNFLKESYNDLILNIRNLSLIGHGEIYPDVEVCDKLKKFIDDFFTNFSDYKQEMFCFFSYPEFIKENIFFFS